MAKDPSVRRPNSLRNALRGVAEREGVGARQNLLGVASLAPRACDPSVIPHDSQPHLRLAPSTKSVSVELTYRDGSASEIKSFRR
jgi:hypothetical protein